MFRRMMIAALIMLGVTVSGGAFASGDDWIILHCSGKEHLPALTDAMSDRYLLAFKNIRIRKDGSHLADGLLLPDGDFEASVGITRKSLIAGGVWVYPEQHGIKAVYTFYPENLNLRIDDKLRGKSATHEFSCAPFKNPFTDN